MADTPRMPAHFCPTEMWKLLDKPWKDRLQPKLSTSTPAFSCSCTTSLCKCQLEGKPQHPALHMLTYECTHSHMCMFVLLSLPGLTYCISQPLTIRTSPVQSFEEEDPTRCMSSFCREMCILVLTKQLVQEHTHCSHDISTDYYSTTKISSSYARDIKLVIPYWHAQI